MGPWNLHRENRDLIDYGGLVEEDVGVLLGDSCSWYDVNSRDTWILGLQPDLISSTYVSVTNNLILLLEHPPSLSLSLF